MCGHQSFFGGWTAKRVVFGSEFVISPLTWRVSVRVRSRGPAEYLSRISIPEIKSKLARPQPSHRVPSLYCRFSPVVFDCVIPKGRYSVIASVSIAYYIFVNCPTFLWRMRDLRLACISSQKLCCRAGKALTCRDHGKVKRLKHGLCKSDRGNLAFVNARPANTL